MEKSKFQFSNPRIMRSVFMANEEIWPNDKKQYAMELGAETQIKRDPDRKCAIVMFTISINKNEEYVREQNLPVYVSVTAASECSWEYEMEGQQLEQLFHIPFIDFTK